MTVTVPARVRTLRGQVVDADGAPVAEAWVKPISAYDELPAVATKRDGAFVFEHLRRGTRYRLLAVSPRGDARGPDSDIDVMIILNGEFDYWDADRRCSEFVAALCLEHDVVISWHFVSETQFAQSGMPLMINVRKEGVAI